MQTLEEFLDPLQYGVGQAKPWSALMQEIQSGECQIVWQNDRPVRSLRVAVIEVLSPQGEHLVEDRQEFTDGRVRQRSHRGVSEKLKPGETPIMAAKRAIAEELGIREELTIQTLGTDFSEHESPSYPGLVSQYECHRFQVEIPKELYQQEYIEVQSDKRNYFVWKKG